MIKTLTKITLLVLVSAQTFAQNTLPATTARVSRNNSAVVINHALMQ
jgi:hypothetical protein